MSNYGYYRPGLPFVVKNLIIINAIVFIATMFAQQFMYQTFSLFYFTSPFFKPFQLITYMFMHGGFWHIFFNMFSLYMFGSVLENYWGGKKFFLEILPVLHGLRHRCGTHKRAGHVPADCFRGNARSC